MPDLPVEITPHECAEAQSSEGYLGADDTAGLVKGGKGLTMEQVRFAQAIGQALVGAWQRESASVVAISHTVANQRSY